MDEKKYRAIILDRRHDKKKTVGDTSALVAVVQYSQQ